ncbi:MAG: hypothetical protein Q8M24_02550 [Pseudolabrys sp.]|nr:hypothetical protein [Pseudolabrys sp.]
MLSKKDIVSSATQVRNTTKQFFAFRLAREVTGKIKPSYMPGKDSRNGLSEDVEFSLAFSQAKSRVRTMEYRFVEECDQTKQALLEIYCAISLECPYNDFNAH